MKHLIAFALLFLWLGEGQTLAQQPYLLTVEDGLPSNTVWRVAQDSEGYLWFGTRNGLVRYNGKEFSALTTSDRLSGESVMGLVFVNDSTLIAASYKEGLNVVNTRSLKVTRTSKSKFTGENLLQHNGLFYDLLAGSVLQMGTWPDLEMSKYYVLDGMDLRPTTFKSFKNELLGVVDGQLIRYNEKGRSKFFDSQDEDLIITSIHIAPNRNWVGGAGFIAEFNETGYIRKITDGMPADGKVHRIMEAKDGKIWLSILGYGLYLIEGNVAVPFGEKLGIGTIGINSFFEDRDQNFWILTLGKGVICIPNNDIQNYDSEDILQLGEVNDFVYQDKLGMLTATSLGVLSLENEEFEVMPRIKAKSSETIVGHGATYVSRLELDFNGDVLVAATNYKGLTGTTSYNSVNLRYMLTWFLDESRKKLISYDRSYEENDPRSDRKYSFDSERTFYHVWSENDEPLDLVLKLPATGSATYIDEKGRLWSGVKGGGLVCTELDRENNKAEFKTVLNGANFNSTLTYNGSRLFGTNLGIYELQEDSLHYSPWNDLLPNKTIKALEEDGDGRLWIATFKGLVCIQDSSVRHWNTSDGLISNQLNALGYHPGKNLMYIGYDAGISVLNIDQLLDEFSTEIPLRFTSFSSRGVAFDQNQIIDLDPESNDVEISYSSLDYSKKEGKRFQYRLNGYEEREWRNTSNTSLEFNSLASDNYTLEVRPILKNGRVGKTSTLNFSIDKVLYKKTWFILLMAALGLLGTSIYFRYRLKQQEKEQERERAVEQKIKSLEYQALSAMMNPHFIFNSLNSIQYFYNSRDLRSANDYLAQFAKLIRMNLDMADRATVVLEDELERLELYLELEQMRLGEIFDYKIDLDPDIDPDGILVPSMIIQPYVENSIFHGIRMNEKFGHISIRVEPKPENYITISITDNGIGINQSKADKSKLNANHESKAMRINEERINIIGQGDQQSQISVEELVDPNGQVQGTQVNIIIPDEIN